MPAHKEQGGGVYVCVDMWFFAAYVCQGVAHILTKES